MSEFMPACNTCRYAVPRDGDSEYLECHRNPIQVVGFDVDGEVTSCFPVTEPTEWCGEYAERWWANERVHHLSAYQGKGSALHLHGVSFVLYFASKVLPKRMQVDSQKIHPGEVALT